MPSSLHRFLGITLWLFFFAYFALAYGTTNEAIRFAIVSFPVALLGSVIPDMDAKNSRIRKAGFSFMSFIAFVGIFSFSLKALDVFYALIAAIVITGVLALLLWYAIPGHRKGIHSFRTAFVYSGFSFATSYLILLDTRVALTIALLGFLSVFGHLALDREVKW